MILLNLKIRSWSPSQKNNRKSEDRGSRRCYPYYVCVLIIAIYTIISLTPSTSLLSLHDMNENQSAISKVSSIAETSAVVMTKPNILLLLPDQWRFDWADDYFLSTLDIRTPTFKHIVQHGTRFINTVVPSPQCVPSRACIATGREYDKNGGVSGNYALNTLTTFYKLMQNNGYHVMTAGKDDLTTVDLYDANGSIWEQGHDLGFNDYRRSGGKIGETRGNTSSQYKPYRTYLVQNSLWEIYRHCWGDHEDQAHFGNCYLEQNDYQDNYVTHGALELLDNKPKDKPWYLQINWPGPHNPYIVTKAMYQSVSDRAVPDAVNCSLDEYFTRVARRDYTAEVENLDKQFSIIIDKLRVLNELNRTIVCVSSDHGDMLADYNAWTKKIPFRASTDVPLVCMGPNIMKKQIIDTYVTNMDLAGTFLDYSQTKKISGMTTISLKPFMNGAWSDDNHQYRSYVSSGLKNWRLVIKQIDSDTTWKYIYCKRGSCCATKPCVRSDINSTSLLFNIKQDPYEQHNVAELHPNVVRQMKQLLPVEFMSNI